jgi:FAD:protein FMN transferase
VRVSRRAMATTFEIAIPYGTPNAMDAGAAALDRIDEIEDQLTVYRDRSEVAQLNRDRSAVVEQNLFELLQQCASLTNETTGAFDAAAGSLIKCWGFYKREGRVPNRIELTTAMHQSGFRHVVLDAANRRVKLNRPGVELNLGAIGKGYALDQAAEVLRNAWGIRSALLQGGGSSVLALGVPPTEERGWQVAIRHPSDDARTLGSVYLVDRALGTSAATYQSFEYNGKSYGHVLDPRSGRPADQVRSASCLASSAAEADALSTAFFVTGEDWTREFCRSREHLAAILLTNDPTARTINVPATHYGLPGVREQHDADWFS